jgi:4-aminobutyrate aminotransferase / (S)-3-amino-2-methylpropionate transaminase
MVTFSKKFQSAGFYHKDILRPNQSYRNFNTWLGDPVRAMQSVVIVSQINRLDLLSNVQTTGEYLQKEMELMAQRFPDKISAVRGQGTFIAFDTPDPAARDKFVTDIRKMGINMGGCGDRSVRVRPMLVFRRKHADIFLDRFERVLKEA